MSAKPVSPSTPTQHIRNTAHRRFHTPRAASHLKRFRLQATRFCPSSTVVPKRLTFIIPAHSLQYSSSVHPGAVQRSICSTPADVFALALSGTSSLPPSSTPASDRQLFVDSRNILSYSSNILAISVKLEVKTPICAKNCFMQGALVSQTRACYRNHPAGFKQLKSRASIPPRTRSL